ncbi:hypothetical protein J7E99_32205 [Streptomyces sp. ISL-44]|uniref:hypothetical protein n=1 Tax=Streptomyces sp. ISL-44 TaxID=2819184 RepID=UPI001BE7071F|nr:hypothetical protein [Streptomyces sp. ISL-44]MBT2545242.1 hypothetical protein [Streptomyces sp. ISL-44]
MPITAGPPVPARRTDADAGSGSDCHGPGRRRVSVDRGTRGGSRRAAVAARQEDPGQVILELSVSELIDRAVLAQDVPLARVVEEGDQPPRQPRLLTP